MSHAAHVDSARAAAFSRALRHWFRKNGRDLPWRKTRDPYRVLVSEAMLQAARKRDAQIDAARMIPQPEQISPTELDLVIVYIPGSSNARSPYVWVGGSNITFY